MHVYGLEERLGPAGETNANAGGEDLGEAVEAQDAPDFWLFKFQSKVGWVPGGVAIIEEVIRVVLELSCGCQRMRGEKSRVKSLPSRMMKLYSRASARTSRRRSSVAVIPVGLHPY